MAELHPNMPKYQIINESVRPITAADRQERDSIKGLAQEIIDRHPTSNPVVDETEFMRLQTFFSPETVAEGDKRAVTPNADPVGTTSYSGSLAKLIIARHGTNDPVLCASEVEDLKRFFPQAGTSPGW